MSVLCDTFRYKIIDEWETSEYYYIRLDSTILTDDVFGSLITQGLEFFISTSDIVDKKLAIAFYK